MGATEKKQGAAATRDSRWQQRLLPFMVGIVGVLAGFFFIASFAQLFYLHGRINSSPGLDLAPVLKTIEAADGSITKAEAARLEALMLLEAHTLERRYHQANVLLMSRIWTKYLGFVTGMILAMVGAAFILGKLREPPSDLRAEAAGWKVSFTSASPGLVLAVLGTLLMISAMVTHFEIQVQDGPLYLSGQAALQPAPMQPPKDFVPDNGESIRESMLDKLKK